MESSFLKSPCQACISSVDELSTFFYPGTSGRSAMTATTSYLVIEKLLKCNFFPLLEVLFKFISLSSRFYNFVDFNLVFHIFSCKTLPLIGAFLSYFQNRI